MYIPDTIRWSAVSLLLVCVAPAGGAVHFVDATAPPGGDGTTWVTAFSDLQSALSVAGAGDQVWVATGTYRPTVQTHPGDPRSATFTLASGRELYGGFVGGETTLEERDVAANETVLSGDLDADDVFDSSDAYHIVTASGADASARLDGFTLTGANATGSAAELQHLGGGVLNIEGSPVIGRCTFEGNRASLFGAGIYTTAGGPLVEGCTFLDCVVMSGNGGGIAEHAAFSTVAGCVFEANAAIFGGDGMSSFGGTSMITGCRFESNLGLGNGLFITGSPQVVGCTFVDNPGSALGTQDGAATITDCRFIGNGTGADTVFESDATFVNCLFTGQAGPGLFANFDSEPTILQCTFSRNGTYGFLSGGGPAVVAGCIFRENGEGEEGDQLLDTSGTVAVSYSSVQGLTGALGGVGNIGADPLFIDADGPDDTAGTEDDDLRLSPGSPCIDAADNSVVPAAVTTDLDGNPRFADDPATPDTGAGAAPVADMGAYEFQGSSCPADCASPADGVVDIADLLVVLAAWGEMPGPCDADGDGVTNIGELLMVLALWGPCP